MAKYWNRLGFEKELWSRGVRYVAGVDEAGCGPLAGPVVAAAVSFPCAWLEAGLFTRLRGLNDSKQLSLEEREKFYALLTTHPEIRFGVASVDSEMIDQINILQAAHRAMNLALAQLSPSAEHVLVDGRPVKSLTIPSTALVKGDARCYSIAAASVIAKVTRDRIMAQLDKEYPGYGFADHKGYGTPQHWEALNRMGPCPIHRRSYSPFKPVEQDLFETVQGEASAPVSAQAFTPEQPAT